MLLCWWTPAVLIFSSLIIRQLSKHNSRSVITVIRVRVAEKSLWSLWTYQCIQPWSWWKKQWSRCPSLSLQSDCCYGCLETTLQSHSWRTMNNTDGVIKNVQKVIKHRIKTFCPYLPLGASSSRVDAVSLVGRSRCQWQAGAWLGITQVVCYVKQREKGTFFQWTSWQLNWLYSI